MAPGSHRAWTRGLLAGLGVVALSGASACESTYCELDSPTRARPSNWEEPSHCAGHEPDYAEVFNFGVAENAYENDDVHRFDIAITAADHEAMFTDIENLEAEAPPDLDGMRTPLWVEATVRYGGRMWTNVGFRYKGHASLFGAYDSGYRKLSFILDFDQFEDTHASLHNQRFFGFNRLSFSSGYRDPTRMRERVAGEIFRDAGVVSPRRAFAEVYLDWGEGSTFLGLYTIIEEPCDTMLADQLGGTGSGTLYKPWGDAARWLDTDDASTIADSFDACSDAESTSDDFGAISDAIEALHADRTDAAGWRTQLEEHLDVGSFLRTLAANQAMGNWDSYGCMHHNYFVYSDGVGGPLRWLPWDLNEALVDPAEHPECASSIMLDEIVESEPEPDEDWPLIRFLLADDVYRQDYKDYLRVVLDDALADGVASARIEGYRALLEPGVPGEAYPFLASQECQDEDFGASVDALEAYLGDRRAAVEAALAADE